MDVIFGVVSEILISLDFLYSTYSIFTMGKRKKHEIEVHTEESFEKG